MKKLESLGIAAVAVLPVALVASAQTPAFEIAYFDRGAVDAPPAPGDTVVANNRWRGTIGGSWGAYYWNG